MQSLLRSEITRKVLIRAHEVLSRLFTEVRGQGIVEYALIAALVAFGAVAAQRVLACRIDCAYELVGKQLEHILFEHGKKIPPGQAKKCSRKCE